MLTPKHYITNVFFFCIIGISTAFSQVYDCTLDIGGIENNDIVDVFQLNESQQEQMQVLKEEYAETSATIETEIETLLATHPQSTDDELTTLAVKYKGLQAKALAASQAIDERFLASFNQKQYDLYLELCHEAFRKPIQVVPAVYEQVENPE